MNINIIDKRTLNSAIKRTHNAVKEIQQKSEKINKKYRKEIKEELEYVCRSAISDFYDSYSPKMYDRTGDLYNAFKVEMDMNSGNYKVRFSPSFMIGSHRVNNDYIFWNSFENGWHGGAIDGVGHPEPGTPYYKNPIDYHLWLRPAVKTTPPYEIIMEQLPKKEKEVQNNMQNEFDEEMHKALEPVKETINKLLK